MNAALLRLENLVSRMRAGSYAAQLIDISQAYVATLSSGGKLLFAGNGGSAADAQHIAAEYVVRYRANRRPYAAIALSTDTSVLTAAGNDLGFDALFARQVEALGRKGDCLILHSTSGESQNLIMAAEVAAFMGLNVIGFLGKGGGTLAGLCHLAVIVPSDDTGDIQCLHLKLEHMLCELVEVTLSEREAA